MLCTHRCSVYAPPEEEVRAKHAPYLKPNDPRRRLDARPGLAVQRCFWDEKKRRTAEPGRGMLPRVVETTVRAEHAPYL